MTFMEKYALKYSISKGIEIEKRLVTKRHEKKFTNLMDEKALTEGTKENPNKTIWNFSSHMLSDAKHDTLKYRLKHG